MNKKSVLIIVGGFAGAGKTTVAARLAGEYRFALLSSDTINDVLRGALTMSFKEASPVAHEVLWHLVRKQLQLGVTVIADVHMATGRTWEYLDDLKTDMPDVTVVPIILQASLETHRDRIEERGRTNKEHLNLGGDALEDVLFKYEFIETLQRPDIIRVDANGSPDEVYVSVEKVVKELL